MSRGRRLTAVAGLLFAGACGGEDGPAAPGPPLDALRFQDIAAGYLHSCGLTPSGSAYCWGGNSFGTLGDGTRTDRLFPTQVASGLAFEQLDAGAGHNCALTAAGEAYCWGHNDEGQLGTGTFETAGTPARVTGAPAFRAVSAGHAHSCALAADGSGWCWGDDLHGQLGDGADETRTKSPLPVRVQLAEPLAKIWAGYYQSCALTAAGSAYCWGLGDYGQNGDGTGEDRHQPVRVAGGRVFAMLAPGDRFVCGTSAALVWCWGANRNGELGTFAQDRSPVPVAVAGTAGASAVFTSLGASTIRGAEAYACALRDGSPLCWGGALPPLLARTAAPVPPDAALRFETLAAGTGHLCGMSRAGYGYCGGRNDAGQLGTGTSADAPRLTPIPGPRG